jgi:hemolysin activation/secretion protein
MKGEPRTQRCVERLVEPQQRHDNPDPCGGRIMKATRTASVKLACLLLVGLVPHVRAAEARVAIDEFIVTGNTLLPQAVLDAALARFKGERTLAELQQAALAVQALYRDAGYGGVVAYVPPQHNAPGRATVAVLEGRVSRVYIAGNKQFSDANIRRAVPRLREGETPQVRRIDAQIQFANENPSRQISLALEPGQAPGDIEARVTVSELPASRWSVALDNTGNESTGRLRAGIGYQNAALWGLDHQFASQLQFAPDELRAVAVVSGSYRVPFPDAGVALDLFGAYSDVDGGTAPTPAGPLQFSGKGKVLGLKLTRPLMRIGDTSHRLSVDIQRRVYLNQCSVVGLPPGACGSAGASVAVLPASIDYQWQLGGARPLWVNVGYTRNVDVGGNHSDPSDFDAVRPGARPRYELVRLGAWAALTTAASWQLQARASGQWTHDALVPGEQFGIGGALAVRGYEEREITGDSGATATVELTSPNVLASDDRPTTALRLLGFIDAGKAFNRLATPCRLNESSCGLASVGIGARLGHGSLQLKLDIAHALKDAIRTAKGDTRVHFQAICSFP